MPLIASYWLDCLYHCLYQYHKKNLLAVVNSGGVFCGVSKHETVKKAKNPTGRGSAKQIFPLIQITYLNKPKL